LIRVKLSQFYAELIFLVYFSIGRIKHESHSVYKSLILLENCPQTLYLVKLELSTWQHNIACITDSFKEMVLWICIVPGLN